MSSNDFAEVMAVRTTTAMRERLRKWREKHNRGAGNPMNESDSLRTVLAAGLDAVEREGK